MSLPDPLYSTNINKKRDFALKLFMRVSNNFILNQLNKILICSVHGIVHISHVPEPLCMVFGGSAIRYSVLIIFS